MKKIRSSESDPGCLLFTAGIFAFMAIGTILILIFGGDIDKELIGTLRTWFVLFLIALGIYIYNNFKKSK